MEPGLPFTIEDARRVQRELGITSHVAYVDPDCGFVLAHTSFERDLRPAMDLRRCEIHRWLDDLEFAGLFGNLSCCFPQPGWYRIAGLHEARGIAL